jgi:hypothetical protein
MICRLAIAAGNQIRPSSERFSVQGGKENVTDRRSFSDGG